MLNTETTTATSRVDSATGWASVCELTQLEPLFAEAALIDGEQIALVRMSDDSVHAVSNQDPVTGSFVMSRGIVGSRGDRPTLASPLHKQVYDLATGECFGDSAVTLRTFETRVEAGIVQVRLSSSDSSAESAL
ncbi:assimilatory nitrite reductase (NAD(P)H) small subunit [Glaciihabitans tibetensis]|uniref:Assimilatory nitrite reductase (NAD(P)H) small subunit n=1 Tax=Glaciihabitans tibetensis TaxID=1266600 RepID=A0A2T0VBV4_9MICO|nr:nitrite reductase small subunit NirD [Glaciihabitans tibetensis]PRY67642.1 assimilatory nitrite reductase (NAD(P)H) small subunit [Glaciihabitans tibetensis]